ncbi:MAG: acyl-CoA carboxylase subunit beta [Gammaproteobacteria bacterium]|jgi:geranyl-CoA carboxylase beta subunit|nr:acyl-CoA carboxylase subunit beta [Gammaproteobacteria bacterium]
MTVIRSNIGTRDADFARNREAMLALLGKVRALEERVRMASELRRSVFEKRGQLSPRERVGTLLDADSPFLEFSQLAGLGLHDDNGLENVMGGGLIVGIGIVAGTRVMIIASDSGIKGGTISPMGMRKQTRAQEMASENRLPIVYLTESGGANLKYQSESFIEGGRIFRNLARISAQGIPQINVVHGSSTAGGAYLPGLSDTVIMVKDRAKVFLAGPPLLKAATGEIADDEALGGAQMHATVSGLADYFAENDLDALRIAREAVAALNWKRPAVTPKAFAVPLYEIGELAGIVPIDFREPYDVREVIARIVDGSDFLEFKSLFGVQTICGQARIEGLHCGIIGNNGPIDADGACKAAQFIQLMCEQGAPIVYLQNTTGFLVGVESERDGIVKHGSKMIQAVSNASVPQITIQIGGSFGAGNYGMCGRAFAPRFLFAWPNNRVAVMGGEQAAKVMTLVAQAKAAREGREPDSEALAQAEREIIDQFDRESNVLFSTARLWDDGIIDPRDTRRILGFCLATCVEGDARTLRPSSFGVARM